LPLEALRAGPQAGPTAEGYGRRRVYVAPPPAAGAMALAGWKVRRRRAGADRFHGLPAWRRRQQGGRRRLHLSMGQLFGAVGPGTGRCWGADA
jgi:gamma-glutamyltranspeptidase/glutathione hydrolase